MTLFHPVLSPDDDFAGLCVLEAEDFLCREGHDEHWYFVLEHLSSGDLWKGLIKLRGHKNRYTLCTHVDLSNVEDFAGADETLTEIHLHRGPKDIIRLFKQLLAP